jgi:hypothetical protein
MRNWIANLCKVNFGAALNLAPPVIRDEFLERSRHALLLLSAKAGVAG